MGLVFGWGRRWEWREDRIAQELRDAIEKLYEGRAVGPYRVRVATADPSRVSIKILWNGVNKETLYDEARQCALERIGGGDPEERWDEYERAFAKCYDEIVEEYMEKLRGDYPVPPDCREEAPDGTFVYSVETYVDENPDFVDLVTWVDVNPDVVARDPSVVDRILRCLRRGFE